jgi:hypothetical protein
VCALGVSYVFSPYPMRITHSVLLLLLGKDMLLLLNFYWLLFTFFSFHIHSSVITNVYNKMELKVNELKK